jgi:hypothetical protein
MSKMRRSNPSSRQWRAEATGSHYDVNSPSVNTVSLIIVNSPKERFEYLRSLFAATTSRDVSSIMSMAR